MIDDFLWRKSTEGLIINVMDALKATEVFTPNRSSPKFSLVSRVEIEQKIGYLLDEGGRFICLQGVTKLGKTTIADTAVKQVDLVFKIDSQNLRGGAKDLWSSLAKKLRQPVEEEEARASSDTIRWSFQGLLAFFNVTAAGDHSTTRGTTSTYTNDLPQAVADAISALHDQRKSMVVVLDDFHFIEDESVRVEILQALKPLANLSVSVLLVTLPERDFSRIFTKANLGGRNATVEIPLWTVDELKGIAKKGFKELNLEAEDETVGVLARNSFGSPQIMQALSLRLCRNENDVHRKQSELTSLNPPKESRNFYSEAVDDSSKKWLTRLAAGKKTKGTERKIYPSRIDSVSFDGYTICLQALKNLGPKATTTLDELKAEVGKLLEIEPAAVTRMQLHGPLKNMTHIANQEMREALTEAEQESLLPLLVPQPFFEWGHDETDQPIKILDPVLLFAIEWHWDEVLLHMERRKVLANANEECQESD